MQNAEDRQDLPTDATDQSTESSAAAQQPAEESITPADDTSEASAQEDLSTLEDAAQAPEPAPSTESESTTPRGHVSLSMSEWWSNQPEAVRAAADVSDDGTLTLRAAGTAPARVLGTLSPEGRDATLKAFTDKYTEVEGRVAALRSEWDTATDRGKLAYKLGILREYLGAAPALGDYGALWESLRPMEEELARHGEASYAARLALVEEAERLSESTDWKTATPAMREMSERWKAAPPLDKDKADELWNRLEKARDTFFERRRVATEEQDKEAMRNLDLKLEIVAKAETLAASDEWKKTTEALKGLMDEWKGIGRVAGGREEELWRRFSEAKTVFFERKRAHYGDIQKEQEENLAKKIALIERAEAIQDSTDWNKTSAEFETILQEWRGVGKVPLEKADEIRDRMERAKDTFFGARRAHFEGVKVNLADNLAQKQALLKRAESLKHSTQWREATGEFAQLMEDWKAIGPVPREQSNRLWREFSGARAFFFERKDADRERRQERFAAQDAARDDQRRQFVRKLEDELREDEDSLADFRVSIGNITPGPKAKELHEHLTNLISQTEERIERRKEKLAQVRAEEARRSKPAENRERRGGAKSLPGDRDRTPVDAHGAKEAPAEGAPKNAASADSNDSSAEKPTDAAEESAPGTPLEDRAMGADVTTPEGSGEA